MSDKAGRREWIGLATLMLPLLLVSMDVSVLFFAVPFIARDLEPSSTQQLWIFDIYGFVLAGLVITMGSLGDRIGRRRLLLFGAAAFSLASLGAAYSQTAGQLIAARALQGVAGATLMPSTLALIRNMFHDEKQRRTAIAIWTGGTTSGIALGPVLSGILLNHFWWGSVFLINVPFMVLLLALAPALVPEFRAPQAGTMAAAPAAQLLAGRVDRAYIAAGGFGVAGLGFAGLTQLHPHSPIAFLLICAAIYAGGIVGVMTVGNELVMGAVPPERAGAAAAVVETATEFGAA